MSSLKPHQATHNPLRALSLGVLFAGTVLATSASNASAMPVAPDAAGASRLVDPLPLRVDPVPLRVDLVPHQVAPGEGLDDIVLASHIDPLTFRNDGGVPHQVAPHEGLDDIVLATQIDPLTSGSQAWSDRLNAQAAALGSQTLRSDSGVPHQVAPHEGLNG